LADSKASTTGGTAPEAIQVRGARVHNLKNISFDIPHNALTVVTGVSGSGKSTLAFDTVYAEGQRRYIESLSAYARQFLERIEKPDVDSITGIAPAIAIRQRNSTRNPRSTVATSTEIYDYLRLLYARVGRTICGNCGQEVQRDTVDQIADGVLSRPAGQRFYLLYRFEPAASPAAPAAVPRRTRARAAGPPEAPKPSRDDLRRALADLQKRGFNRLYQAGRVYEFTAPEELLDLDFAQPVYVVADRLSVSPEVRSRLIDGVELCYREGRGEAILEFPAEAATGGAVAGDSATAGERAAAGEPTTAGERLVFNERFECKRCGIAYQEPEPSLFSFNSPYGACPRCQGFGNTIDFDLNLVIPDRSKTLNQGAIDPWTKPRYRQPFAELKRYAKANGIPLDVPFRELSARHQELVIEGDPAKREYSGIKGFFAWLERKKYKLHVRVFLSRYRGYAICPDCHGTRLRQEARAVKIEGRAITDICKLTVAHAREFFRGLQLSPVERRVAQKILEGVSQRLGFLDDVGLEYITLERLTSTLSGGEAQRIQLATSLGSRLVGALYILDEPSIGLHPRDTHRLIEILKTLRDLGNTILVVEHDRDLILAADHVLDLGPGAGEHGGRLIFSGTRERLLADARNGSLTARYLTGEARVAVPAVRRKPSGGFLRLHGARGNNLQDIDLAIPLGLLACVTGVSGSGKSTLVHEVIWRALEARRNGRSIREFCARMEGDALLRDFVLVDQSPIGRTPRSNPATYLKAFDSIRDVYAVTPEAVRRGFSSGNFSFNIPGGRCEACQGDGTVTVEMQFLADVELVCEECHGTRFKSSVLEVRYREKNIHEALQLTVREAVAFFSGVPRAVAKLRVLDEVGLGYLRLGQSATTLSGGEAQRLKLAAHLTQESSEGVLYILDEPTTGLHFEDIQKLLTSLRKLIERGASLLVIEHNLDVIKSADWVIDLGPEGGERGGRVVAAGTPEQVARNAQSYTGKFLQRVLNHNGNKRPRSPAV